MPPRTYEKATAVNRSRFSILKPFWPLPSEISFSSVTHQSDASKQTQRIIMNSTLSTESVSRLREVTSKDTPERKAWVAKSPKQAMALEVVDLGPIQSEEVEVAVEHCGLCHSDLSVLNNDWGISKYPAILGHEIVGRVTAVGSNAKRVKIGQRVGVGWNSGSCMHCRQCMSGDHHLCASLQPTIVGHSGGFASHVRTHWAWTLPLPNTLNFADAGPLLCGGVTVFLPLAMLAKPTSRVGIIGIGGLGHMAVKFAAAFGCDVTAFTSTESKFDEAKRFGANHVVSSRDSAALKNLAGSFDLLISTVNVPLDWQALTGTLAPKGRIHVVGAVLEPIPVSAFSLILGQHSISGSLTGAPTTIETMLDFAARHNIAPQTEHFPMSNINEAFARLKSGQARYRIVLDADF
jgi:alcohol/geraniol dehydrogenase (NADP+)